MDSRLPVELRGDDQAYTVVTFRNLQKSAKDQGLKLTAEFTEKDDKMPYFVVRVKRCKDMSAAEHRGDRLFVSLSDVESFLTGHELGMACYMRDRDIKRYKIKFW